MLDENLRNLRKSHHFTQQNIADVLGIDRSAYTFYEIGKTRPSLESMKKLCDIYNVSLGYLCGYEENNPELRREKVDALSSVEIDPIANLPKEERYLLMYFRVLNKEDKEKALEFINSLNKQENC